MEDDKKLKPKYGGRLEWGITLSIIAIVNILISYKKNNFIFDSLFWWILGFSLLGFGIYSILISWLWSSCKNEDIYREFYRYLIYLIGTAALFTVWVKMSVPNELSRLLGFGFGIINGTWLHTIFKKIEELKFGGK